MSPLVRTVRNVNPAFLRLQQGALTRAFRNYEPDLIHALRIPLEGMSLARLSSEWPTAVSVWGNDFTLHADRNLLYRRATRRTMVSAVGLHADCHRDVRLAREWGLRPDAETLVVPGSGGLRGVGQEPDVNVRDLFDIPPHARILINPRGVREYVRLEPFFAALPALLARHQDLYVVALGLQGVGVAESATARLAASQRVRLLPSQTPEIVSALFREAEVSVSLTTHDGTPNTLLEAMSAGAFPVVSPIESVLEWITPGVNGLIAEVDRPEEIVQAVSRALEDKELRTSARETNSALIHQRAVIGVTAPAIRDFYGKVLERWHARR